LLANPLSTSSFEQMFSMLRPVHLPTFKGQGHANMDSLWSLLASETCIYYPNHWRLVFEALTTHVPGSNQREFFHVTQQVERYLGLPRRKAPLAYKAKVLRCVPLLKLGADNCQALVSLFECLFGRTKRRKLSQELRAIVSEALEGIGGLLDASRPGALTEDVRDQLQRFRDITDASVRKTLEKATSSNFVSQRQAALNSLINATHFTYPPIKRLAELKTTLEFVSAKIKNETTAFRAAVLGYFSIDSALPTPMLMAELATKQSDDFDLFTKEKFRGSTGSTVPELKGLVMESSNDCVSQSDPISQAVFSLWMQMFDDAERAPDYSSDENVKGSIETFFVKLSRLALYKGSFAVGELDPISPEQKESIWTASTLFDFGFELQWRKQVNVKGLRQAAGMILDLHPILLSRAEKVLERSKLKKFRKFDLVFPQSLDHKFIDVWMRSYHRRLAARSPNWQIEDLSRTLEHLDVMRNVIGFVSAISHPDVILCVERIISACQEASEGEEVDFKIKLGGIPNLIRELAQHLPNWRQHNMTQRLIQCAGSRMDIFSDTLTQLSRVITKERQLILTSVNGFLSDLNSQDAAIVSRQWYQDPSVEALLSGMINRLPRSSACFPRETADKFI